MAQDAPKSPTCWFCQARPPDKDSASQWEMHRETGAEDDEEVASISKAAWEPLTVPVPRCAECKRAHDRRERFVEKGWKVGLLLGVPLLAALFVLGLLPGLGRRLQTALVLVPAVFFACGIGGGIVGWLLGKSSLPPGVRDQSTATQHPNIKSMEAQGWKIGSKPRV